MTRTLAATALALLLTGCGLLDPDDPAAVGRSPADPSGTASQPPTDPPACNLPCYDAPTDTGIIDAGAVEQPSGLAASLRTPDVYYVVSDVAGTSSVGVIREDGSLVAMIEIDGMSAANAEALATGPCGASSPDTCLFVADIGDHVGRPDVVIYRAPEPDLSAPPASIAADAIRYTYPDGPTDAEALIVDSEGRPIIISKAATRDAAIGIESTIVYRGASTAGELEAVAELVLPSPATPVFALIVGNVVTGADTVRDGRVLVRTYDEILEYFTDDPAADVATFASWEMRTVPTPTQVQAEAVSYRAAGCGYVSVSERSGAVAVVGCP